MIGAVGLCLFVAAAGTALAQSLPATVVEPTTGVVFPLELTPPGGDGPNRLVGTAVRQRTIFRLKIYAFGLYVDPAGAGATLAAYRGRTAEALARDDEVFERLLDLDVAMSLRLVMTRTVSGDDIAEAFEDALRPRLRRAAAEARAPGELAALDTFAGYFDVDQMRSGTEIVFSCDPAGGLTMSVATVPRPAITSILLCRALFDVYLGTSPVSAAGKRAVAAGLSGLLAP